MKIYELNWDTNFAWFKNKKIIIFVFIFVLIVLSFLLVLFFNIKKILNKKQNIEITYICPNTNGQQTGCSLGKDNKYYIGGDDIQRAINDGKTDIKLLKGTYTFKNYVKYKDTDYEFLFYIKNKKLKIEGYNGIVILDGQNIADKILFIVEDKSELTLNKLIIKNFISAEKDKFGERTSVIITPSINYKITNSKIETNKYGVYSGENSWNSFDLVK